MLLSLPPSDAVNWTLWALILVVAAWIWVVGVLQQSGTGFQGPNPSLQLGKDHPQLGKECQQGFVARRGRV